MAIWSAEIRELEKLYESFKGQLPELEKELVQLIRTEDPNVILLYSRRCLEVIITGLCECELKRERGTEPLKGIIDKLNKERKVPAHIITSMDHLNSLSSYGTHPKDFDPEQVKPVLNNLTTIVKWYVKYKEIGTVIKIKSAEREKQKEIGLSKEKPLKTSIWKLLTGVIIIIVLISMILIYPKISTRERIENSKSDEILGKAIEFYNFLNRWDDFSGKVHLTTVNADSEKPFEEVIEIRKKENFYQSMAISSDTKQIRGIQNGECFKAIDSLNFVHIDSINESECQDIQLVKGHHYMHFGLLMELKTSGLTLKKKVKTIKFQGFNCLALVFARDSLKVSNSYFNIFKSITVFLDPSDYSIKGYETTGSANIYVVCSGILNVNGIKMPKCKTYFNSADNSFRWVDVFTTAD